MDWIRLLPLALISALMVACADDASPSDSSCTPPASGTWEHSLESHPTGAFMSVWGPSPDKVLAVGGQPDLGSAYLHNSDQWEALTLSDGPMLNWVHGTDDEFFIVGNEGRALRLVGDPRDPTSIDAFDLATEADLWGVWAYDSDNVWAVGGDARDPDGEPALLFFDGQQWESQPIPELDRQTNSLFKIWGTSTDQVFAVGARGVILEFDGQQWTQVSSGASDDFVSLWGQGPDEIIAVGGRSNGQIATFDGQQWNSEILGGSPGLNGIWMDCQGTAHINGVDGHALTLAAGADSPQVESTPTSTVLHASFGFDDGPRYAVGGTLLSSPPYTGTILVSED